MIQFVTTLTDSYSPGLIALLQSLVEHAAVDFRMTVVHYDSISSENRAACESVGIELEWVPVQELGLFPAPASRTQRMVANFQKPLIWRLPYEKAIYIDSDILCLGPLTEMEDWGELSVVQKQTSIVAASEDAGPDGRRRFTLKHAPLNSDSSYMPSLLLPWNAGVFAFQRSEETLQGIMEQARSYRTPIQFGDQVVLNDYFNRKCPEKVTYKSLKFNMSTWVKHKFPELFQGADIRLLHFAHDAKPWKDEPEHQWQVDLWNQWRSYYERALTCS